MWRTIVVADNLIQVQLGLDQPTLCVPEGGFEDVAIDKLDAGSGGVETHCEGIGMVFDPVCWKRLG